VRWDGLGDRGLCPFTSTVAHTKKRALEDLSPFAASNTGELHGKDLLKFYNSCRPASP
jgi:hypothetical protein